MPDAHLGITEIEALEDRRYRAMIDGDTAVLDALCSDDLIYTHSKGDHDDKRSYLPAFRLPRNHTSGGPHLGRRRRGAHHRQDDGQGLGYRQDRSRR
jgi:hypothetical protein